MRQQLRESFRRINILDLHGSTKRGESGPDGVGDKNVFDIQQGVAIGVFVKSTPKTPVAVVHADLWGDREAKYRALSTQRISGISWTTVHPSSPFQLFVPTDSAYQVEYDAGMKVTDIFTTYHSGIITKRDALTIHWTADDVFRTVSDFVALEPETAREKYGLPDDVRDWKVQWAQGDLRSAGLSRDRVIPVLYRPFDMRFTYFTGRSRGFVGWPVADMTKLMLAGENVALVTTRMTKGEDFGHVLLSRHMAEVICLSAKTSNNGFVFPLYSSSTETHGRLFPEPRNDPSSRGANLGSRFFRLLSEVVSLRCLTRGHGDLQQTFGPADAFNYIVGVLQCPTYRERYREFLSRDFPRIPLPGSVELFRDLSRLGSELVALHLMESPALDHLITTYTGQKNSEVRRIGYSNDTVWLDAAATKKGQPATPGTIGFRGVPEAVWNFHIGGYQVCEKWLKDRKGRTLSNGDIAHYQKIVVALAETIRLMKEIDEVIEQHGGWPGAFQTAAERAAVPAPTPFRPRLVKPRHEERYVACVPLVPLKIAAGAFGDPQHVEDDNWEWVAVETKHRLRPGMFVAQIVGKSMEPAIPDGSYCLFAAPVTGTRQGKTVLVQLRDGTDPETGERYTVKRYESEKTTVGDSWRHAKITLKPVNPDFEPIVLTGADDDQLQVVAELIEVLSSKA